MSYHLVMVYTVSRHKTEAAAKKALHTLQGSGDDIAFVLDVSKDVVCDIPDYKPKGKKR